VIAGKKSGGCAEERPAGKKKPAEQWCTNADCVQFSDIHVTYRPENGD